MYAPVRLLVLFPTVSYNSISPIFYNCLCLTIHFAKYNFERSPIFRILYIWSFSYKLRYYVLYLLTYLDFASAFPIYGIGPYSYEGIVHLVKPGHWSLQDCRSGRAAIFVKSFRLR